MNPSVDWTSASVILAAGLILGGLVVYFFRRRASAPRVESDLPRKDLEAKRDALLQQLRGPDLAPTERTRLEVETAQVLRELDQAPAAINASRGTETPAASAAMNPTIKGFLWGAGSVGALAALFYFVMQQSTPRAEGGSLTGSIDTAQQAPMQSQPPLAQNDPIVLQLEAAVQRDPNNLKLRNDLAQAYLERDNLMAVFEQTKFVLAKSPNDGRALTFQGLVRMAMGETDSAVQLLRQATKADPKNLDGWVALAWVFAQSDHMSDAEATMTEAMNQSPNDRARLEQVFAQMKQQLAQQKNQPVQTASGGGALPEGHPPVDGAGAAPPAPMAAPNAASAAPSGAAVHVTVDLDPAAKTRSGIVFVIVRNPAGGPPIAVKRIIATSFPTTVDLSAADSMMGQQLPVSFRLEARLDTDGDPLTRPTTDPTAMQEGVTVGSSVTLSLR